MRPTVVALLATCWMAGGALTACSGDPDSPTPAAQTTQPSSGETSPPSSEPVSTATTTEPDSTLNEFEKRLIPIVESIGVTNAGVAEHGFRAAWIAGDWQDGIALIHGYEQTTAATPGDVIDTTVIAGEDVEIVATQPYGEVIRLRCAGDGYEIAGMPDGWEGKSKSKDATEIAELLIPELGC